MDANELFKAYESAEIESRQEATSRLVVKTYLNLTGAVLAFTLIEALIFAYFGAVSIVQFISENSRLTGLALLGLCLGGPFLAHAIFKGTSRASQYGLLAFYVIMYALIFVPLLALAMLLGNGPGLIWQACGLTAALFLALTSVVFMTRKDFSFLRSALFFAGIAAIILIIASFLFNFTLGTWFSAAMILFACGFVLYDTSRLILQSEEGDDVFMAVEIFSSLMTLFYYVLRILMAFNRR